MSCAARTWNVPIPLWPYVMLCPSSTFPLEAVYKGSEQQHSAEPDTFHWGKIHLTSSCFSDTVKVRTPVKNNPLPPSASLFYFCSSALHDGFAPRTAGGRQILCGFLWCSGTQAHLFSSWACRNLDTAVGQQPTQHGQALLPAAVCCHCNSFVPLQQCSEIIVPQRGVLAFQPASVDIPALIAQQHILMVCH